MMEIGYFLSCEEYAPSELVDQARRAEDAGFDYLWVSDHFHPWNQQQGESTFVWALIGALSQACDLPVETAVTCPTVRMHPAIVAHAAASAAAMLRGRFTLGLGTGEALNEHVTGQAWPHEQQRLEMLEEAVTVIRRLWSGEVVSHHGRHYTVDTARIFTLPEHPTPIYLSGFGPKSIELAGRIADGFITTSPDLTAATSFREMRGAKAPIHGGFKVAYAPSRDEGIDHAHRLWSNSGLPGELAQVLPTPEHIQQASSLVTREMTASAVVAGNDADEHIAAFETYADAGFDGVAVANMGPHYAEMLSFYGNRVIPALREAQVSRS